jgi:hypothetical protein
VIETRAFRTHQRVGDQSLFSFRYVSDPRAEFRSLRVVYAESEHDVIVFHDDELPIGKTYEIRADGVWADMNCEIPNEHWSFSMESFALRVPIDEYLLHIENPESLLIGDRVAFGYELDATTHNGEDWFLSGDVLIEKAEIPLADEPIRFSGGTTSQLGQTTKQ